MPDLPTDAVVYVYICKGDARPEEHEVRDLLPQPERWRKIAFLHYVNGSDPESHALARLHSIGPTHRSFVTVSVDRESRKYFDQVLPPSRESWLQKAREHLETSVSYRAQMRTSRLPKDAIAQHVRMLSISAGRLIRLSERGQTGLEPFIHDLNSEIVLLVMAALK